MEGSNPTTTNEVDAIIQMFTDGTSGEVYANGRLTTRECGEGRIELIAYGWNKLAEYDESTGTVTIFAGHAGNVSKTVTGYVNKVREIAGKRTSRTVVTHIDAAPNVDRPPAELVRFINNYIDFCPASERSSIEQWSVEKVNSTLKQLI